MEDTLLSRLVSVKSVSTAGKGICTPLYRHSNQRVIIPIVRDGNELYIYIYVSKRLDRCFEMVATCRLTVVLHSPGGDKYFSIPRVAFDSSRSPRMIVCFPEIYREMIAHRLYAPYTLSFSYYCATLHPQGDLFHRNRGKKWRDGFRSSKQNSPGRFIYFEATNMVAGMGDN